MKKEFLIWFLVALCIAFLFFFSTNSALGAVIIDNLSDSGWTADNRSVGRCGTNEGGEGQSFQLDAPYSVDTISVKLRRNNNPGPTIGMRLRTATSSEIIATSTTFAKEGIIQASYPASTTIPFTFSPAVSLEAETTYFFELFFNGTGDDINFYSNYNSYNQSSYADGIGYAISHSAGSSCDLTTMDRWSTYGGDVFFKIEGEETPQDFISITSPENATTTSDFGWWEIDYGFGGGILPGEGAPDTGIIEIKYGISTSSLTYSDSQNVFAWLNSSALIPKGTALNIPDTYYAQAYLYTSSSVQVATSSMISFDIEAEGGDFGLPDSTSTISEALITCDPNSGFFASSICKVLVWVFVPTPGVINNFINLKDIIEVKPPFGYFGAMKEAFSDIELASSSISLADLTPLEEDFFGPVKTALVLILWISFGFWIFHRFRKIEI